MRMLTVVTALMLLFSPGFAAEKYNGIYGIGAEKLTLATGSPGELGLVKVLAEEFSKKNNATLNWIKAGTGESMSLLKNKKADIIMIHAPAAEEKKAVKEGWAAERTLIGSNEFYIVGPEDDPAGIASAKTVAEAYKKIALAKARFLSRGDNSGTHKKELAIWKKAGIKPAGEWYVISKGFMAAILKKANDEKAYFMTDSSTWIAFKRELPALKILFKGDKFIINTYHAMRLTGNSSNAQLASRFIRFVASNEGQEIIRSYGKIEHGESLYNDAEYSKKFAD